MTSEIIETTEYAFSGVIDIVQKAIIGLALSFFLIIFTRYLDNVFGWYWLSNEYTIILGVIIVSSIYSFINYDKFNLSYTVGWIIGIYLLVFFNLIVSSKAIIYAFIPIIILLVKWLLFR